MLNRKLVQRVDSSDLFILTTTRKMSFLYFYCAELVGVYNTNHEVYF